MKTGYRMTRATRVLLTQLSTTPGGGITGQQLMHVTELASGMVYQLLTRLSRNGYVTALQDTSHHRRYWLTGRGQELAAEARTAEERRMTR